MWIFIYITINMHLHFILLTFCNIFLYKIKFYYTVGKPAIGAPWSLVDLNGRLVTEQDFAGKW